MTEVRVAIVAITRHGAAIASRLAPQIPEAEVIVSEKQAEYLGDFTNPRRIYQGALSAQIGGLFESYDQIIFLVSLGAVVRLIAPHLKSKDEDPGVLVIDDAAEFVIPVLSGHVGGANAYAEKVAALLKATPVLTTASDVGKTIPVDILGRELGWQVEAPKINITRVSADVVNQLLIAFVQESGSRDWWTRSTPLPTNIHLFERFEDVDASQYRSILWVTRRDIDPAVWQRLEERLVVYRPPLEQS
ncbi:cobalamin biosynthesis central domain-containing protein [Methylobacter sp. YRD-M1]|uniref:cobalamin biosynthesis central domain-containing protein n=1 Tax=Methylobacter sp. YRD-M1 TaxID=2911520 RepID=UPI00227B6F3E|nr:cobalamin biosynthesis central domain-containing protein [Methylobacter sp. YRD-M1]WAK01644.1 cobalamin biosynthesis protein CbiG [Methylobacter sp. YRD-M1]